jgi:hypothetical protein
VITATIGWQPAPSFNSTYDGCTITGTLISAP